MSFFRKIYLFRQASATKLWIRLIFKWCFFVDKMFSYNFLASNPISISETQRYDQKSDFGLIFEKHQNCILLFFFYISKNIESFQNLIAEMSFPCPNQLEMYYMDIYKYYQQRKKYQKIQNGRRRPYWILKKVTTFQKSVSTRSLSLESQSGAA